jgi:peptidyl-tRNA hydrolase, PTH1 family
MTAIRLIVGLGNPGPEHELDRHNAGFWFVDEVARAHGGAWKREARFHGDAARAKVGGEDLWLLKPGTYMNRSGQAVSALARFYRITPAEILVAHDELDLPPGALRLKRGGGSGGHNGLKDISAAMGGPDYGRLRIGIGHPRDLYPGREVVDFVLQRPSRAEQQAIDERMPAALHVVPLLVSGQWERAGQQLHTVPKAASDTPARAVKAPGAGTSAPGTATSASATGTGAPATASKAAAAGGRTATAAPPTALAAGLQALAASLKAPAAAPGSTEGSPTPSATPTTPATPGTRPTDR